MNNPIKFKKYGMIGGLLMLSITAILAISGEYEIGIVKYVKYIPLFVILFILGKEIKNNEKRSDFFTIALKNGISVSAMCGAIMGIGIIILFLINPAFAPLKFNVTPDSIQKAIIIAFMLFFETFVFGSIFNFIVIQGLKPGAETVNQ